MTGPNYYQLLSVPRNAGPDEIRQAYVRLLKHSHPDMVGATWRPAARVDDLQRAYRCLLDPDARKLHDAQLEESDLAHTARLQRVQRRLRQRSASVHRPRRRLRWRPILLILTGIAILARLRLESGT